MIVVYIYASHGSLDRHLGNPSLTWTQRLKIGVGVARAMNYLHDPQGTQQCVLHQDIKSSNILLDEDWVPKVSDFGLSRIGLVNHEYAFLISNVVHTPGYCDPVYMERGLLTKESDVYSLGVVLFELMCGRLCYEYTRGRLVIFVNNWRRSYEQKRLDQIIFSDLRDQMDLSSLNTFSSLAYRCLNESPENRPSTAEVMKTLHIALEQQEDFDETMRIQNLMISPVSNTPPNHNLLRFPNGVLVCDGNTWVSKLKNGKVCEVISAAKCISADSLVHDDKHKSRFLNVIKGGMHRGFMIKVTTQFLSPEVTYTVSLIFKHNGTDHGTHIPFKLKLDKERYYSNSCMTHVRDDGWLMIELHHFKSYKREHDIAIQFAPLFDITSSSIEYFLEGVEFLPVQYVN